MSGEHAPRARPYCDCGLSTLNHRPSHTPKAWPVCTCGANAANHRVKHKFCSTDSDTCARCGLLAKNHLTHGKAFKTQQYRIAYVGIDGEGIGRKPHRYVMLCAAANDGRRWSIEDKRGLKTVAMLSWMLETLDQCRVFSYGFGYDITCILRDMPDNLLYRLLRPGLRYDKGKLRPVNWRGYKLNWLQGRLTIQSKDKRVVIWDLIKFYQQSFVATLQDWEIDVGNIDKMKAKRSVFRFKDMARIKEYSIDECVKLAQLAEKLLLAHKRAGLTLKSYYGPGSTASVMLGAMKVKEYMKDPPALMRTAIASAFFGGRFEHSKMGIVKPCYGADISSAYPYHAYLLPCLKHGKWEHVTRNVKRAIRGATISLIRYSYRGKRTDIWAPFPHRNAKGAICYPYINSGWTWHPEFRAAEGFGQLLAHEAWVYCTACECQPFSELARYYRARVELGKDGQGRVIKLGVNSVYGKLAQSKGQNPPFQNWIWAGLITSGTRAQVLDVVRQYGRHVVAIATDGIFGDVPLNLSAPQHTGTADLPKPLGGWECKEYPDGLLFLKPGIYLSLKNKTTVKARGIGRRSLERQRRRLIQAWKDGRRKYTIKVDRFHGAKSSITPRGRTARFGQWSKMPIRINFTCPNRDPDTMGLLSRDGMSHPYNPSLVTEEALQAHIHRDISYEQP